MFIIGLFLTCFSLPLAISMIRNLYLVSKYPYTYHFVNGFTEENVAMMAILFTILALTGIVLMIYGWMKRRKKAALDSIANIENQNFCDNCQINVSGQLSNCPICGKALQNKGE